MWWWLLLLFFILASIAITLALTLRRRQPKEDNIEVPDIPEDEYESEHETKMFSQSYPEDPIFTKTILQELAELKPQKYRDGFHVSFSRYPEVLSRVQLSGKTLKHPFDADYDLQEPRFIIMDSSGSAVKFYAEHPTIAERQVLKQESHERTSASGK